VSCRFNEGRGAEMKNTLENQGFFAPPAFEEGGRL
jgi:hypothetical protein